MSDTQKLLALIVQFTTNATVRTFWFTVTILMIVGMMTPMLVKNIAGAIDLTLVQGNTPMGNVKKGN